MVKHQFEAELMPSKQNEFMLSWRSFLEHLRNSKGLNTYQLNQENNKFSISITWKNKEDAKAFKNGEWYVYLLGALKVLGAENTVSAKEIILQQT